VSCPGAEGVAEQQGRREEARRREVGRGGVQCCFCELSREWWAPAAAAAAVGGAPRTSQNVCAPHSPGLPLVYHINLFLISILQYYFWPYRTCPWALFSLLLLLPWAVGPTGRAPPPGPMGWCRASFTQAPLHGHRSGPPPKVGKPRGQQGPGSRSGGGARGACQSRAPF